MCLSLIFAAECVCWSSSCASSNWQLCAQKCDPPPLAHTFLKLFLTDCKNTPPPPKRKKILAHRTKSFQNPGKCQNPPCWRKPTKRHCSNSAATNVTTNVPLPPLPPFCPSNAYVQATLSVGSVNSCTVDFGDVLFNSFYCVPCVLPDTLVLRCTMFTFCVKAALLPKRAFVACFASWFSE